MFSITTAFLTYDATPALAPPPNPEPQPPAKCTRVAVPRSRGLGGAFAVVVVGDSGIVVVRNEVVTEDIGVVAGQNQGGRIMLCHEELWGIAKSGSDLEKANHSKLGVVNRG